MRQRATESPNFPARLPRGGRSALSAGSRRLGEGPRPNLAQFFSAAPAKSAVRTVAARAHPPSLVDQRGRSNCRRVGQHVGTSVVNCSLPPSVLAVAGPGGIPFCSRLALPGTSKPSTVALGTGEAGDDSMREQSVPRPQVRHSARRSEWRTTG